jgi:hypothetical protein
MNPYFLWQVTFVPEVAPPPEFRHDLQLGGNEYTLYTHSFLNFGQVRARLAHCWPFMAASF